MKATAVTSRPARRCYAQENRATPRTDRRISENACMLAENELRADTAFSRLQQAARQSFSGRSAQLGSM